MHRIPVLIVEDDDAIADLVGHHLERTGYSVARASRGDDALAMMAATFYPLVILDLMLPGRTGLEVCAELRGWGTRQPIVLVLTALLDERDAVAAFDAGADDYVRKPFGVAELIRRVRALVSLGGRRVDVEPARVLTVGGLSVDQVRRTVTVDGVEVAMTPKEFDLLAHLMDQPGVAMRRDAILTKVWGYCHDGYARTVDSHVMRVRKKLAKAGIPEEWLRTVRGFGYKFASDTEGPP